ncbi:uncharacterized protein LOC104447382 [Eucalyptus grandis]|uniref:uncharacterized protein LOC104447382 n=1 Tax=Eucalyptus grandis TaxID=71139 RepID=UPI00192EBA36|nr:uncharacterized protein LOC104447382 [Eucalyptus grandis]
MEQHFDLLSQDDLFLSLLFDVPQVSDSKYAKELQFLEFLEVSCVMNMNPSKRDSGSSSSLVVVTAHGDGNTTAARTRDYRVSNGGSTEAMMASQALVQGWFGLAELARRAGQGWFVGVRRGGDLVDENGVKDATRMGEWQILPENVLYIGQKSLCEAMFLDSQKFYRPFQNRSALLIMDYDDGQVIRESERPYCHRLLCAECSVPWHAGVSREEFQSLNEDERGIEDLIVRELAKERK